MDLTRKSFGVTVTNAGQLMRVTGPVFLLMVGAQMLGSYALFGDIIFAEPFAMAGAPDSFPEPTVRALASYAFGILFSMIIAAVLAIRVHRYVLLESTALGPVFSGRVLGRYILNVILLALISFGLMFVVSLPFGLILAMMGKNLPGVIVGAALLLGAFAVVLVFLVRLSIVLPAMAIGEDITLGECVRSTKGLGGAIFVALGLAWLVAAIVSLGITALAPFGVAAWVGQMLLSWPFTVYTVMVLTVLYGHSVEGRALSA